MRYIIQYTAELLSTVFVFRGAKLYENCKNHLDNLVLYYYNRICISINIPMSQNRDGTKANQVKTAFFSVKKSGLGLFGESADFIW